jgi:CRP-like cAMP-binding protein
MTGTEGGDHTLVREIFSHQAAGAAKRICVQPGAYLPCEQAIYFPIDAVASVSLASREMAFQLGFAARGDAIGIQSIFTAECPPLGARVLKGGTLISVSPDLLRRLVKDDPKLRERLSSYAMRSLSRYLGEAACAVSLSIERRVAQWIHRYREVLGSDSLPVTHQQVASALGVRRSGVTVALHVLEGEHLVRSRRARIEVLDPEGLLRFGSAAEPAAASAPPASSPEPLFRPREAGPRETAGRFQPEDTVRTSDFVS